MEIHRGGVLTLHFDERNADAHFIAVDRMDVEWGAEPRGACPLMLAVSLHLNDGLTEQALFRPALIEAVKAVSNEAVAWD